MAGYKNACRVCLVDGATIPIFKTRKDSEDIREKLFECFDEKVEDILGHPRNICEICYLKLEDVINFRKKYKASCRFLMEQLKEVVKKEFEDDYDHYYDDCAIMDVDPFQVTLEAKPKIVFSDAKQLEELIKPLVNNLKQEPSETKQSKTKKSTKTRNPASTNSKNKTNKENKNSSVKKTIKNKVKKAKKTVSTPGKNKVIAASILEGNFVFTGENWEMKPIKLEDEKKKLEAEEVTLECPKKPDKTQKNKEELRLCDLCGATFNTPDKLRKHIKEHNSKPVSEKVQCNECGKLYSRKTIHKHVKCIHGLKDKVCPTCGQGFTYQTLLDRHIKYVHLKAPRAKKLCHICGKAYSTSKMVLMHVRSVHTGERPVGCTVCDAKFVHEDYLKEHMRLHTGETPYKCPVCNRGYAQRCNMKSHIKHNHRISDLTETQQKTIHQRYLRFMKP